METTFTIRKDELDSEFLESVKRLFKNARELQITISSTTDFNLTQPETGAEYIQDEQEAAFKQFVGSWQGEESAEELEAMIYSARNDQPRDIEL